MFIFMSHFPFNNFQPEPIFKFDEGVSTKQREIPGYFLLLGGNKAIYFKRTSFPIVLNAALVVYT